MRCQQTERRLHQLLDDRRELDADPQLIEHLTTCADCATLAAAFALVVRPTHTTAPTVDLTDRVLAELVAPVAVTAHPVTSHGKTWGAGLALAASVLIAVGVWAVRKGETPAGSDLANSGQAPSQTSGLANAPAASDVPGRDMWFRTGQGLASMTLVGSGLPSDNATTNQSSGDPPVLRRALDTLWQLWPKDQQDTQVPSGETGWNNPPAHAAIA